MRLKAVERGQGFKGRVLIRVFSLIIRRRLPDVMRTFFYRPEFFGRPFRRWVQQVMRGPAAWSVGERELFAAFVSRLNQCPF